jgi:hypothetical protein
VLLFGCEKLALPLTTVGPLGFASAQVLKIARAIRATFCMRFANISLSADYQVISSIAQPCLLHDT